MPPDMPPETPPPNSAPAGGQPPPDAPGGETPPGSESAAGAGDLPAAGGDKPAAQPDPAKESAIAKALQRREAALVQRELAFRRQQQDGERTVQERVQRMVADEVAKALKAFDDDPIAFAKQRGIDESKLAGRLLNQGKKTPEEIAREAHEHAERLEKQIREREAQASRIETERAYLASIEKNADKYPHLLDEWTPDEIVLETHRVVNQLRAKAEREGTRMPIYSDDELAEYLDGVAKSRQSRRDERKKARSAPASADTASANGDGKGGSSGPQGKAAKPATATLSGRMSGERQTVQHVDLLELSPDEQRAHIEAEVKKSIGAMNGKA